MDRHENTSPKNTRPVSDQELEQIRESLRGLKYGAVQITVQDGVIVQIDRTEKRRLRQPKNISTE